MSDYMTDERLAEIKELVKYESAGLWDELLQALKAERERIKELEMTMNEIDDDPTTHNQLELDLPERGRTRCQFQLLEE